MIKLKSLGMLDVCKNDPTVVLENDITNHSFVEANGDLYLVMNEIVGDEAYKDAATIKAGEFLNCFLVKEWEGQNLIVDAKHITGGVASLTEGTSVLVADTESGKLKTGTATGVHFKVVKKVTLTEPAVEVRICVA